MLQKTTDNNITYFVFENLLSHPVTQGIFTRTGGHSSFPYKGLNVGLHVNDNYDDVMKNRIIIMEELGSKIDKLIGMNQVHCDHIEIVGPSEEGNGAYSWDDAISSTDALICSHKNIVLMAVVADCGVTLLYSPEKEVVAIAHCGWRGTAGKLPSSLVKTLEAEFHVSPSELIAGICPSIGPCCYEVGPEVFNSFSESFGSYGKNFFYRNNGSLRLDIKKSIKFQLLESGVKEENIEIADLCTSCRNDLFFSYRTENGNTGRNGVFIGMT